MISIIIPVHNSESFMPGLMDSIFRTGVEDMEVIIVDDCSTDGTVKIAENYPVNLIRLETNSGPARARNRGVHKAKGDIIFFLDADLVVMDGTIKEVQGYFAQHPSANCVIGICSKEPLNKGFVPKYMALFEYIHLKGSRADTVSVFSPRCGAVRKDFFKKIGGYDETYKGADVEDFELARRINKEDRIILNREMVVIHRFANFKPAVRNYFKRAAMWVHLFIKERQFDNAGPSVPSNGIAAVFAFLSLIAMLFIPFNSKALYYFLSFLLIYLLANLKWLSFMQKEAGLLFAVRALFLNYILGINIMIAVIFAFIAYPFTKGVKPDCRQTGGQ